MPALKRRVKEIRLKIDELQKELDEIQSNCTHVNHQRFTRNSESSRLCLDECYCKVCGKSWVEYSLDDK